MKPVAEWLKTPDGLRWAREYFSMDPTACHDMIEVIDDYDEDIILDHAAYSSDDVFQYLIGEVDIWADLTWTPDHDPTRILPVRHMQGHRGHLGRETAGQMP